MNDGPESVAEFPATLRSAITTMIASRFAIFEHEAKIAARSAAKSAACLIAAILALGLFWLLGCAALIGWLAAITPFSWFAITGIGAGIHLLAGGILLMIFKSYPKTSFALTREEFRKDRAWLDNLHPPKSKN